MLNKKIMAEWVYIQWYNELIVQTEVSLIEMLFVESSIRASITQAHSNVKPTVHI